VILIPCPHCDVRNSSEFRHVGEADSRPDPATVTPQQWRAYLYERSNPAGWTAETWYHTMGCRRFLRVERNTVTNEIRSAQPIGRNSPQSADVSSARTDAGAPDAEGQPS